MTVSELIQKLQAFQDANGDLEVYSYDKDNEGDYEIEDVSFCPAEDNCPPCCRVAWHD